MAGVVPVPIRTGRKQWTLHGMFKFLCEYCYSCIGMLMTFPLFCLENYNTVHNLCFTYILVVTITFLNLVITIIIFKSCVCSVAC